jgi:hypothetical protein
LAGEPIWQFVERAGAYAAPLALLVLLSWQGRTSQRIRTGDATMATAVAGTEAVMSHLYC